MISYTATYSPEDNKIRLYASGRLPPEVYAEVRAVGFIWAPKQDLFVAPMWTPDRADLAVALAGELGDEDRTLAERAEDRAERFDGYQGRRRQDAAQAHATVAKIADGIPLGQPILVGHHSERHARKDAERIETGMRKAVKMWETAEYWKDRARGALQHARYKDHPRVRANRIKTLGADLRRVERSKAQARTICRVWRGIGAPYQDGRPCDLALQLRRAETITTVQRMHGSGDKVYTLRKALEAGAAIDPGAVRAIMLASVTAAGRSIVRCNRWIQHYQFRITYETQLLGEQGAAALLVPKARPKQPPLWNYRAPGGVLVLPNKWQRQETISYPQVDLTQAEYAKVHTDYKGTRLRFPGTTAEHRVRTMMQRHTLVSVFLTDAKVHPVPTEPSPEPEPEAPEPEDLQDAEQASEPEDPEPEPADDPHATDPDAMVDHLAQVDPPALVGAGLSAETIAGLRQTLKGGITVRTVHQLFPTPRELAARLVQLADLQPGHRVLEPSAGTGAILGAMGGQMFGHQPERGAVVAVEIDHGLCLRLRADFPLTTVHQADFLSLHAGDLGGPFDRVVMNPPFERASDVQHIEHAAGMLAPGGVLVAVCANGSRQRAKLQPKAEAWIDLPPGTFEAQGTGVNTAIVILKREQ